MIKPGVLQYRCKRCGLVSADCHVPDISLAIASILGEGETPPEWGAAVARAVEVHACGDGAVGLADLIGAEADRDREVSPTLTPEESR